MRTWRFFPALSLTSWVFRRRQWQPIPVFLPGNSHGWRSLVGCSPWGREESDTTERLHFHFSLFLHWRRRWQPTPVFLPGESQRWGSLVGCHLWGHTESTRLKRFSSSSGGDGIPIELFQIPKDDAIKVLPSVYQQIQKPSNGHRPGKGQSSSQFPRRIV